MPGEKKAAVVFRQEVARTWARVTELRAMLRRGEVQAWRVEEAEAALLAMVRRAKGRGAA